MADILLPHQREAFLKMRNGCILKGATGTGKTITSLAYYDDAEDVEQLIVITTAKKRDAGDWQAEARLLGIFPEVDSWQNISNYENVEGAFFIFDEQRVVGSGAWVKSFLKITKKNQWVLLSATPGDSWLDYIPVFIANGFYRNRTDFLEKHVQFERFVKYPKVRKFHNTSILMRHLDSILISMPYSKKTIRHEIEVFCEHDRELYDTAWRKRWNFLEGRPIRQVSELFSLIRRVANTDPSRLERIRDLLIEHPKMIIFYNFDYELEILRTLCRTSPKQNRDMALTRTGGSSGLSTATAGELGPTSETQPVLESYAVAEWNGHKHEKIPEGNEWVYLVQYSAGSEGWNCTETDTVVFYSLTYSYRMFEQSHGRIDRLDTPYTDLWYFVLKSATNIDRSIFETLLKKENFNEGRFLKEEICPV
jgi:hypothetical protein